MEKPEKQNPQESKVAEMRRRIEEICKKHGWKCVDKKADPQVFTVSFKKKRNS